MRTFTGMLDGTATTATNGTTQDMGAERDLAVFVVVTAISGTTPSATFVLQDSADGVNWATVVTSAAVTATGVTALRNGTTPVGRYARVILSALTGTTPSITTATSGRAL